MLKCIVFLFSNEIPLVLNFMQTYPVSMETSSDYHMPFVFHTPSNLGNQKLNKFSRKPPKQLLPVHVIFIIQGTLPVGT